MLSIYVKHFHAIHPLVTYVLVDLVANKSLYDDPLASLRLAVFYCTQSLLVDNALQMHSQAAVKINLVVCHQLAVAPLLLNLGEEQNLIAPLYKGAVAYKKYLVYYQSQ